MNIITDEKDIQYAMKYLAESNLAMHGHVWTEHFRKGKLLAFDDQGSNTFTTEGMASILNTYFKHVTTPAAIYCGVFKNNVVPALADTAAAKLGAGGTYGECQDADYTPATNRPEYVIATTSTAAITNTASKAEFTVAGAATWYGAFLATSQAKTATTGALVCAKKFTTARTVEIADVINVIYAITMTTS